MSAPTSPLYGAHRDTGRPATREVERRQRPPGTADARCRAVRGVGSSLTTSARAPARLALCASLVQNLLDVTRERVV